MRAKIVLLYETEQGKALCDIASYVLAQTAVAFGHTFTLPVKHCKRGLEISDEALELCGDAAGILLGESGMDCLPSLAEELLFSCRLRELRYTHLIENQSLMGRELPLQAVLLQALSSREDALRLTAAQAYAVSARDNLPIAQVPPAGKLAESWQRAVEQADSLSAPFHARETALAQVIPDIVHRPGRMGVILCPPYAGSILADAAAALTGAEGMCFDVYLGGQCPMYAALRQDSEGLNPFGMLRAIHRLLRDGLKLEREAACVEAAIRNVLQAGWRTADIAGTDARLTDAENIADLICQQIEVAGEWIANS